MTSCRSGPAPAHIDFSQSAILARARAHAAEQAARAAPVPDQDSRSPAELLIAITAGIAAQAPEPTRVHYGHDGADPLADMVRAIHSAETASASASRRWHDGNGLRVHDAHTPGRRDHDTHDGADPLAVMAGILDGGRA